MNKEINVKKKAKIYEGKSKIIYETDHEDYYIQEFKDDAIAFNGTQKGKVKGKSSVNNQLSGHLFTYLESYHVPTHFIRILSENTMVVRKLVMVPVEVVMHNIATGSLVKRYGAENGKQLDRPVLEFYLKDDSKQKPLLNKDELISLNHATDDEVQQIERFARKINAVLKSFFYRRDLLLVEFKLEFGHGKSGKIKLGDELSPDTCRLWDIETDEKGNKDRFRQDSGKIGEAYQQLHNRVLGSN